MNTRKLSRGEYLRETAKSCASAKQHFIFSQEHQATIKIPPKQLPFIGHQKYK